MSYRRLTKIFAVLISVIMLFTMVPVSAFAEENTVPDPMPQETVISENESETMDDLNDETEADVVPSVYQISFDLCGHSDAIETISVEENGRVAKPLDPAADGYVFEGWYTDNGYAEAWDFDNDAVVGDMVLYAKWIEKEEEPEPVAFDQSETVNGVTVTVRADPGVFPAGALLSVEAVPVYRQAEADNAIDIVREENQNVAVSYSFDIKVIDPASGGEVQPAAGHTVSVSFALAQMADENLTTNVYHVAEEETTGELTAEALDVTMSQTTGGEACAVVESDGFSIYTVEFTYNDLEYVMQGDTSVALSEILREVGLSGDVTAVTVSDESLFSVSNETGEWIVTAHMAFSSTEWMRVTIDGVVYEIKVTDSELDQYRYYYESTTLNINELDNIIGISEEEVLLGYLCFLCNGSTYNFTWGNNGLPLEYSTSGGETVELSQWNANITGKTLTIRDTNNQVAYTETLSSNNVWKLQVGYRGPYDQYLFWEPANVETYTVTYNKNTDDENVIEPSSVTVPKEPNPGEHPAEFYIKLPRLSIFPDGYTFDGWYTEASGGTKVGGGGESYLPKSNITLYAHWKGTPVTVDFGEGHENYVQNNFSGVDGITVDGAKVSYEVSNTATIWDAYNFFMQMVYDGIISNNYDSGEYFMDDAALKPAEEYTDYDNRRAEQSSYNETVPADGLIFYAQWAKPVGPVSVTIVPPEVGTEVTVENQGTALERTKPAVEVEVTGNATLDTVSGRSWLDSSYSEYFTGTVEAGRNCFAGFYLYANYGYYFTYEDGEGYTFADNTSVTATNASGVIVAPSYWRSVRVNGMVWTGDDPEPTIYSVNINEDITGGTVTAHPITAHKNNTVIISAIPDEGYILKTVTWTPEGGEPVSIEVSDSSGGEFSFKMPAANVTVNATFDKVNMVYVDFGEGHEDFVQKYFSDLDEGYEVNGSVVSYQFYEDDIVYYHAASAYELFNKQGNVTDSLDDGVSYMYDIALHPRSYYEDEAAFDAEWQGYINMPIHDGITFYALWADPLENVTITVTPPECGTEVKVEWKTGSFVWAQPGPKLEVEGNCHFNDYQLFYNDWELNEYGVTSLGDSLVMKGGNSYTATGYLGADWGYFLPENMESIVVVNGGTLMDFGSNHQANYFRISVPVSHVIPDDAEIVDATCTEPGSRKYTCPKCNEEVDEIIPALGHDFGEPAYTWADDNSTVTATHVCANDETHIETETVKVVSEVTKKATCTDKGETTYTARFDNEAFELQTKTLEDIDATGHDWGDWVVTKEATENEEGVEMRTCKNDPSHTETRTIPAKNHEHKLTHIGVKAATCTEDGNIKYWICDQGDNPCGRYFSDQEGKNEISKDDTVINATGHDWGDWVVTKEATENEEGVEMRTCKNDPSHTETRTIPKLDPEKITYRNTAGDGLEWTKGSNANAEFTFKRSVNDSETFSHFKGIQVDEREVATTDYTARAGSVIISLKASYLETLSVGEHTLTVSFEDGNNPSVKFSILAKKDAEKKEESSQEESAQKESTPKSDNSSGSTNSKTSTQTSKDTKTGSPKTGDRSNVILWLILVFASAAVLVGMNIYRKKRSKGN